MMVESIAMLEIAQLRSDGGPTVQQIAVAQANADVFAEKSDILMGVGGKSAKTIQEGHHDRGKLIGDIGRAVAILAFFPGGVTLFGRHYEEKRD